MAGRSVQVGHMRQISRCVSAMASTGQDSRHSPQLTQRLASMLATDLTSITKLLPFDFVIVASMNVSF
jgi:hypothetical protein